MGRGKIEIKRIENSSNRQVTYSKRRNGIIKKAKEISVLCDAQVSLIIFASSGKMHEYCSPSTTLVDILDKYHKQSGKKLWDAKHENLSNEIERIKKENDSMQIKLRHLKGEDITSLNHKELMTIEDALENGLSGIREKKNEKMDGMRKHGKVLEEENRYLHFVLRQQEIAKQQQEMAMESNVREIDTGYQRESNDHHYSSQMPFAFRVQPIQPNLQERI
nr:PISTILLATA/GLOBOSA [Rhus chinensis]